MERVLGHQCNRFTDSTWSFGKWGNRELFGYDRPTFGYRGRKTEITDFNNDGYPDYYRAGSWEDGRAPEWLDPDDRWSPSNWGNAPQKSYD